MTALFQFDLFLVFFSFAVHLRELAWVKNAIFSEFFLNDLSILGRKHTYFQISMMVINYFPMIKSEISGFHDFSTQKSFSITFPDLCEPWF